MKAAFRLLMLLTSLGCAAQDQDIVQAKLSGSPVQLTLIRADDLSPTHFPTGQVALKEISVPLAPDNNVFLILQSNGIAPDSQSFAAVYELNPSIQDLNKVAPNTTIIVPSVVADPNLRAKLNNGYLVELTLYPELRRSLNQRIKDFRVACASIAKLTKDPNSQAQLRDLLNWFNQIGSRYNSRTDPPLRRDTVVAMNEEAGVLLEMCQESLHENGSLTPAQLVQVKAIHGDLQDDIAQYNQDLADVAPRSQTAYKVTVNVEGASASLSTILRVYYTYNGLFRPLPATPPILSYPFDQLGTSATRMLAMKNYQIWASRDGDPNHPVTACHFLSIEPLSPTEIKVDLSFQKQAQGCPQ